MGPPVTRTELASVEELRARLDAPVAPLRLSSAVLSPPGDQESAEVRALRLLLVEAIEALRLCRPDSVAHAQALRSAMAAQQRMHAAERASAPVETSAKDLSQEEWRERIILDAKMTTMMDLEHYVAEWLTRIHHEHIVEGDVLSLRRVARSATASRDHCQ